MDVPQRNDFIGSFFEFFDNDLPWLDFEIFVELYFLFKINKFRGLAMKLLRQLGFLKNVL